MNVIQLRDKLNKLIEEGKGDYLVYDDKECVYELDHIVEGFVVEKENSLGRKYEVFYSNEEVENAIRDKNTDLTRRYSQEVKRASERLDKINAIILL